MSSIAQIGYKTDLEIAQSASIKPIAEIAQILNINKDDLELYGKYKAKVPLNYIDESKVGLSNLILVTAITPTPPGEGKTTTSMDKRRISFQSLY